MTDKLIDQCLDFTASITVELQYRLIDRQQRYARENQTSASGLMINLQNQGFQQTVNSSGGGLWCCRMPAFNKIKQEHIWCKKS
mgnify:CR=1 FL=1